MIPERGEERGDLRYTEMNAAEDRRQTVLDCLLFLLITAAVYAPFLGLPAWEGNEPVRVIVARDMLKTGDWAIPMLHGKPYFVKPPLMNWLIAASGSAFGRFDEWTTRFPSVIVAFLTCLTVYFLTTRWLTRGGRFFASLATLTMVSLIEKGTSAEIDTLLIFLVCLSLLVWINGYLRQWNPVLVWSIPLFVLGVGFLTKGPQVPAFFYLTVVVYLFLKKRPRYLFSGAHAAGLSVFVFVLAGYLAFVLQEISLNEYLKMWSEQITQRAETRKHSFLEHLASYPFSIMLSFMPWTLFALPVGIVKELRAKAGEVFRNELIVFALLMFAANLPVYWLLPNARVRYFLPAGPFAAIILGGLFEYYLRTAGESRRIASLFRNSFRFFSLTVMAAAVLSPAAAALMKLELTPAVAVIMFLLAAVGAAGVVRVKTVRFERMPVFFAVAAGLFFLLYTDLDVQRDSRKVDYQKKTAAEFNKALPEDAGTVYELGYRRFLGVTCYLAKDVIQLDRFDELKAEAGKGGTYFLFDTAFLASFPEDERRAFTEGLNWEKIHAEKFKNGEIVLARLI